MPTKYYPRKGETVPLAWYDSRLLGWESPREHHSGRDETYKKPQVRFKQSLAESG